MKGFFQVLAILLVPVLCGAEESKKEEKVPFFPKDVFIDFTVEWYSEHLGAMKEPSLPPLAKQKDAVIYRFTCLRTFHKPFAIRITKTKDSYLLIRKILSGQGGYEPGKIESSVEKNLKPDALAALEKLLTDEKFAEWKAVEEADQLGTDGSQWIVEVVKNGGYKVVDRWTPREGTATRRIGEEFLSLAKWKPEELY